MIQQKNQPRRRWSEQEKRQIAREARRLRATGDTWPSIIAKLNVLESSLRRWMQQFPETALQPVRVVEAAVVDIQAHDVVITLSTPDGFHFDGLDVATAAELWRRLR